MQAQGEGPRAFELMPEGSQAVNVYGVFGRGNESFDPGSVIPKVEVDVNGSIIEYARGFALAGKAGSVMVSLPAGNAVASVPTANGVRTYTSSGIGDLQLTAAFGLLGSPALQEKDYEAYRPRFAVNLLARVYLPTGVYDRTAPVNLGENRRSLQLGVPLAYYLGESFLDPALTTFELVPSVTWYGDNDEPVRGTHSSQAPLLQLEGHITRISTRLCGPHSTPSSCGAGRRRPTASTTTTSSARSHSASLRALPRAIPCQRRFRTPMRSAGMGTGPKAA